MKKVSKKKGFTLAELLVVLAILAVLVAVAIPLFTGAIGNAKTTAVNANKRAIRAAAVVEILTDSSHGTTGPWAAKAHVGANGDVTGLTIEAWGSNTETTNTEPEGDYVVKVDSLN